MKYAYVLIVILHLQIPESNALQPPIRYIQTGPNNQYVIDLLELIINKTNIKNNPTKLEPVYIESTKARKIMLFRQNVFDVMWLPVNKQRISDFLAIQVPILQGILGYRVLVIKKERADDFRKVVTMDDLRDKFIAGFGTHWADLPILTANGLRVEHTANSKTLYDMLSLDRFDYFPRGIDEAWLELQDIDFNTPDLIVEESIALYLPLPVLFFRKKR